MEQPEKEREMAAIAEFWMNEMEKADAQGDELRSRRAQQAFELALAKLLDMSFRRALETMNREDGLNIEIPPSLDTYLGETDGDE